MRAGNSRGAGRGAGLTWTAPLPAPLEFPARTLALYCGEGDLSLPQAGLTARAGELLLCRRADSEPVALESGGGTKVMAAVVYTR